MVSKFLQKDKKFPTEWLLGKKDPSKRVLDYPGVASLSIALHDSVWLFRNSYFILDWLERAALQPLYSVHDL
jgi:hypothetical protein